MINKFKHIFFIFLFAVLFFSCSDDPVKPSNQESEIPIIDSNVFDWEFVILPGSIIVDIDVMDSNKIYLASWPNTLYYDGNNFTTICQNASDFEVITIKAFDQSNVFIGGSDNGFPISSSKLKKWNGSTIEEIPFPTDSSNGIAYIYIEGINDIWLATNSNKTYHFDGSNLTVYYLPIPSLYIPTIVKDKNGTLLLFGLSPISNGNDIHSTFKFSNGNWNVISYDTISVNSELGMSVVQCGDDILRTGKNKFFIFNGTDWEHFIETPGIDPFIMCGPSKNNILIFSRNSIYGQAFYFTDFSLLVQTDFIVPPPIQSNKNVFVYKNGRYYGFTAGDPFNNALIKGKFKK